MPCRTLLAAGQTVVRRLWIDTDMGFDDLAALLTVADAREVQVTGVSLVAGNARLPRVIDNACLAAATFGLDAPIHAGAAGPLLGPLVTAAYVLGESGMATVGRSLPPARVALDPLPAADALAAAIAADAAPLTVLALGPLTNLAILALWRPALVAKLAGIVWLGGSAGPGNHTAAAEFNAAVDPEAVAVVLQSGIPFKMVGLDVCRRVLVDHADAAALRALPGERAALLADLLEAYVAIGTRRGRPGMALYDPTAAAALLDPAAVAFAPARIEIERGSPLTRGMTLVELRVPEKAAANAEVAVEVDAGRVRAIVLGALGRAACNDGRTR